MVNLFDVRQAPAGRNVMPYYQAIYLVELVAATLMGVGLALHWWTSDAQTLTAFGLFDRSVDLLEARSPDIIGQPLIVLWLLWPAFVVSGLRGLIGTLVPPVAFRWTALGLWLAALMALGHFLINFGSGLAEGSPLEDGRIDTGFWLTAGATLVIGVMLVLEFIIEPRPMRYMPKDRPLPDRTSAAEREAALDAEYLQCPACGATNVTWAATCYHCEAALETGPGGGTGSSSAPPKRVD